MNRRKFLNWLGVGTAAVAVAPSVLPVCEDPWCGSIAGEGIIPHDELHNSDDMECGCSRLKGCTCKVLTADDYSSFSQFALTASISSMVSDAAAELSRQAGLSIHELAAIPKSDFKFFQKTGEFDV
jgi:hypothetical protein